MSYTVLARKYRPQTFSEVIGQSATVRILQNSIRMDRIPSGMLITGTRGTGKTTLARLYAKAINCETCQPGEDPCRQCSSCLDAENETHPDIIEFDAASNNGVDFVRDLETYVSRVKTYKRRIFIFDEVHMFTSAAQSAFLKLLEEPPSDVTFILVTTDPAKLLQTVRSRCLSMPLSSMSTSDIELSVMTVLDKENIRYTDDFVKSIALLGEGSLRDVQQYLDQVILAANGEPLDSSILSTMFGVISVSVYRQLAGILSQWNLKAALEMIEKWYNSCVDLQKLYLDGIPNLLRDMTLFLNGFEGDVPTYLSGIPFETFKERMKLNIDHIKYLTKIWNEFEQTMEGTQYPRVIMSLFFATAFGQD